MVVGNTHHPTYLPTFTKEKEKEFKKRKEKRKEKKNVLSSNLCFVFQFCDNNNIENLEN
jgi:glutamine amidotransferase-like uncharacterized protein